MIPWWTFLVLVAVAAAVVFLTLLQSSASYERIIEILTRDRDDARAECQVLRGLLLPKLNQPEVKKAVGQTKTPRPPEIDRSIPFRKAYRKIVAQFNTQQKEADTLVEAVRQGEKNAS